MSKYIFIRGSSYVQSLYSTLSNKISPNTLTLTLKKIRELPNLNKTTTFKRNKKGVLIEIIGKKGHSKQLSIDYYKGVWYFDGNRIGKRKLRMVKALFSDNTNGINHKQEMYTIWKKIEKHSNVL